MLLLSRLAENLYWTGRYMERAENTARLLNVNYYATLESAGRAREYWTPLLELMGGDQQLRAKYGRVDARSITAWMAFDRDNPSSIASSIAQARENARGLRDRIPSEMWEALNRTYLQVCFQDEGVLERDELFEYCASARDAAQFFFGIAFATLPRDEGWAFMRAGQMLERGDNTLRVLRGRLRGVDAVLDENPTARAFQEQRWISVLKGLSAYEAYRKNNHSGIETEKIADYLLLDEFFPRSVKYSAINLKDALKQIDHWHPGEHPELLRQARWLVARLNYVTLDDILQTEEASLEVLIGDFNRIGAAINLAYFEQE